MHRDTFYLIISALLEITQKQIEVTVGTGAICTGIHYISLSPARDHTETGGGDSWDRGYAHSDTLASLLLLSSSSFLSL